MASRWIPLWLYGLQGNNGNLAAGQFLLAIQILDESRKTLSLLTRRRVRPHLQPLAANLDDGVRICEEVAVPGWTTVVRSNPVRAPLVVSSRSLLAASWPLSLPPLARNSAIRARLNPFMSAGIDGGAGRSGTFSLMDRC
jgi:hypothetical protein